MKILSWNARGLGKPEAFRYLTRLARNYCPEILFLMETKLGREGSNKFRRSFVGYEVFCVEAKGRSGGLALLWRKEDIKVVITGYSDHCINFKVESGSGVPIWRASGVYGWPEGGRKHLTWSLLRELRDIDTVPWICFGDFNEVAYSFEKEGGADRPDKFLRDFRRCLWDCELFDMGFKGSPFTWTNCREGEETILERLDRFLKTVEWDILFPNALVFHLTMAASDHCPLLMDTDGVVVQCKRPFRFEAMWTKDASCRAIIEEAWRRDEGRGAVPIMERIEDCANALKKWNKECFGHIGNQIKEVEAEIQGLEGEGNRQNLEINRKMLENKLLSLQAKEETMWKQRSRSLWMLEGDRNTKFFHSKANARRKTNSILKLRDGNGKMCTRREEICNIVVSYFEQMFSSGQPQVSEFPRDCVSKKISGEESAWLQRPFMKEEVERALNQFHNLKAPGPDGMPTLFYRIYWDIVGNEVLEQVLMVLNGAPMPHGLNHTFITLIPKIKNPEEMKDLRPISLCNVVYKLISKCIANRLKEILNSIIDQAQSAFVPGRLITDNALIAFEAFHSMKNNKAVRRGCCALKLDMSKAYDRVEWEFLEKMMNLMLFPEPFIRLVMKCVSSASFSFLINGTPEGFVKPTRGLRQGDPLSPYLFLICAEGLSSLIRKAERQSFIHGLKLCSGVPLISHLLFADDALLFFKAENRECQKVRSILNLYERVSGQKVNFDKSEISFSKGVGGDTREDIKSNLGVKEVGQFPKYLGLPSVIGRSKRVVFSYIKDRILKRVGGWKEKLLSRAGREVLIKAIAQAVPQYIMSCFALPSSFCAEIQQLLANYWWDSSEKRKGIHWKKWESLCCAKKEGGLGFRHIFSFNQAMLAKQLWRFVNNPESLCARIFRGRYFPNGDIFSVGCPVGGSYIWRSLLSARPILERACVWRVGSGLSIRILKDRWLLGEPCWHPIATKKPIPFVYVGELIDQPSRKWKVEVIEEFFFEDTARRIFSIPLSHNVLNDSIFWPYSSNGRYTVKSGYYCALNLNVNSTNAASTSSDNCFFWKKLWQLNVHPKIKHCIWSASMEILPSSVALAKKHIPIDPSCVFCRVGEDSLIHIFKYCPYAKDVWKAVGLKAYKFPGNSCRPWFVENFHSLSLIECELFCVVVWFIWWEHNKRNHGDNPLDAFRLGERIRSYVGTHPSDGPVLDDVVSVNDERKSWIPPGERNYKMNVDAAFSPSVGTAAAGFVIRNSSGEVLLAGAAPIGFCSSAMQAELSSINLALRVALESGFFKLQVASDSISAVSACQGKSELVDYMGIIVADIKSIVSRFCEISFVYENRRGNEVAHYLAKWGLSLSSPTVMLEEYPAFVTPWVVKDMM